MTEIEHVREGKHGARSPQQAIATASPTPQPAARERTPGSGQFEFIGLNFAEGELPF
jgi:hypothetical protein